MAGSKKAAMITALYAKAKSMPGDGGAGLYAQASAVLCASVQAGCIWVSRAPGLQSAVEAGTTVD